MGLGVTPQTSRAAGAAMSAGDPSDYIVAVSIGDHIGDYVIAGELGAGGMGRVYRVEHRITGRVEAMKVLLAQPVAEDDSGERFLREIKLQASLNHPNVASVHNALVVDGQLVMIMELVEGESLEQILERGRVPLAEGLDYICQSLTALSYAHARGITHRDIKPANLLVTPESVVKVTDFGLARTNTDPRLTASGTVLGSLYYLAPEQVKGLPDVDARADLYSLGAVLYEVVTGQKPFEAEQSFALMKAHVEQVPRPPVELDPALPLSLNDAILKVLAKQPAERFQSAEDFLKALEHVKRSLSAESDGAPTVKQPSATSPTTHDSQPADATGVEAALRPTPAHPAASASQSQTPFKGAKRMGIWALLTATVVALLIALTLRPSADGPHTRGPQAPPANRSQPQSARSGPQPPVPDPTDPQPSGPSMTGLPGFQPLAPSQHFPELQPVPSAVSSGALEPLRTVNVDGSVSAVGFSPDHAKLLVGAENRQVRIWDIASGKEVAALAAPHSSASTMAMDSSGEVLAAGGPSEMVRLWEIHTGNLFSALPTEGRATALTFSPGGSRLAVASSNGSVVLWHSKTGKKLGRFGASGSAARALSFSPDGRWLAAACADGAVRLWDLDQQGEAIELNGVPQGASCLRFSREGRTLATSGKDTVAVWDLAQQKKVRSTATPYPFPSVALTRDDQLLSITIASQAVQLWDVSSSRELGAILHTVPVATAVLSADGRWAVTTSFGGQLWLWTRQPSTPGSPAGPARSTPKPRQKEKQDRDRGPLRRFIGIFR